VLIPAMRISASTSSSFGSVTEIRVREVREERRSDAPLFVHPEWMRDFPWLVHGVTDREAGNFSRFAAQSAAEFDRRWLQLRDWMGMPGAVLGRQVHGAHVLLHRQWSPGLLLADDSDGQITAEPGLLVAVSVADCVPVLVVNADRRTVAVLHAGWRGIVAGIARACIDAIGNAVHIHLGPAICGSCYEVGPEVYAALSGRTADRHVRIDLRVLLAAEFLALGVPRDNITRSAWCTRCGDSPFYSHRGGYAERQVAAIGIIP
jgi:YfiH family protein